MAIHEETCTDATVSRSWDGLLAHVISRFGSPPVLSAVATAMVASTQSDPRAWHWAVVYVSVAILTPVLYLAWLLCRGQITDLGLPLREQRVRPLIFALVCAGLAWLVLAQGGAPEQMVALARGLWLLIAVILGITLSWKISVHSAVAAGVATLVWSLGGTPVPLLIGVLVVAWSRVRLGRHAVDETVTGALLGQIVFFVAAR
jgi:membrane-associated phospholipid phosphatase